MHKNEETTPFSIDQLRQDVDKAATEIVPWVETQVRRKIAGFRFDDQQIDEICSRIVDGIRKKAKAEPLAFANFKKLEGYAAVAARNLAVRAFKKAQRVDEFTTAEHAGNKKLAQASFDRATAVHLRRQNDELLDRIEAWVAKNRPMRDLIIYRMSRSGATGVEMAEILGIERNAVYQAKNRLKKKCALWAAKFSRLE